MSIVIQNLSFGYRETRVLHELSATITKNRFTALMGRNGSGKSTLLRIMAGIMAPDSGCVLVTGRDIHRLRSRERARLIGYLPQAHHPVFPFSVREVVLTGRTPHAGMIPRAKDFRIAEESIDRLKIGYLADRPYTELSGGERQLVMIARVLAQRPEVILLDEPTAHLDLANQVTFLSLLRSLTIHDDLTVIAAIHDPNLAFIHSDAQLFLVDGHLLEPTGNPPAPWDPHFLKRVYGLEFRSVILDDRNLVFPVAANS